jgi:hypothetical protein
MKPKSALRLRAEVWLWQHPYHLTHDAFQEHGGGGTFSRAAACQQYYDFVRLALLDDTGNLFYPTETRQFCERMKNATAKIRVPFGIVRDWKTSRSVGDPPARAWAEIIKLRSGNPALVLHHRDLNRRDSATYRHSEHGSVVRMLYEEKRKEVRKDRSSAFPISFFGDITAGEIGKFANHMCVCRSGFVALPLTILNDS